MGRVGVFGTTAISISSGFAAAHVILSHFYRPTEAQQQTSVRQKEAELASLTSQAENLRQKISRSKPANTDATSGLFGSVFNRIESTLYGTDISRLVTELSDREVLINRLRREIDGLELMQVRSPILGPVLTVRIVKKRIARVIAQAYGQAVRLVLCLESSPGTSM